MKSIIYYATSFGVLMILSGSVIVLADEVENIPQITEDKETTYVYTEESDAFIQEDSSNAELPETGNEGEWEYDNEYGNKYYYTDSGEAARGFITVNDMPYYFGEDGLLYKNRAETIDGKVYIFEENGAYEIAQEGWNSTQSYRYYVEDGNLVTDRILTFNQDQAYFMKDGKLLQNDVVEGGRNSDNTPYYYGAIEDGRLVLEDFFLGYYFGSDGKSLTDGFTSIDGKDYYIEDGKYVQDTIRNIDGTTYIFDITGTYIEAPEGITTSIRTYYVVDGLPAEGFYEINGTECYFVNGVMQKKCLARVSDSQAIVTLWDGSIVKDSWYTIEYPKTPLNISGVVYADENGYLLQGLHEIDGEIYIFGDEDTPYLLNTNKLIKYDGNWYYADYNGRCTLETVTDGLIDKSDSDKFYIRDGELVKNEVIDTNRRTYIFGDDGKCVTEDFWKDAKTGDIYYGDFAGRAVKQSWVQINGSGKLDGDYYFDENGKAVNGWYEVGDGICWFVDGRRLSSEITEINGSLYKFNANGTGYTNDVADGVYTDGRCLQVVRNGILVRNEFYQKDENFYLIDGSGSSKWTEGVIEIDSHYKNRNVPLYVYMSESGVVIPDSRVSIEDDYDLFTGSDGYLKDGYFMIDWEYYAVARDRDYSLGFMSYAAKNNLVVINDVVYAADSTGILKTVMQDTKHSLSLSGNIGVNFYYSLSDFVLADQGARVEFTIGGKTETQLVKDGHSVSYEYNYKIFTKEVLSVQMSEKILAKVIMSTGQVIFEEQYSVRDYCDTVFAQGKENNLTMLMRDMLNYGGYSQVYFNYRTDDLANHEVVAMGISYVTPSVLQPYEMQTEGSAEGLNYLNTTLSLESTTSINHIFTVSEGHFISEYTFMLGDTELTPIKRGKKYYIVIDDICSYDLDTPYTVSVGDFQITYSVFSYGYKALISDAASDELKNVMRALYNYNGSANTYFHQ